MSAKPPVNGVSKDRELSDLTLTQVAALRAHVARHPERTASWVSRLTKCSIAAVEAVRSEETLNT